MKIKVTAILTDWDGEELTYQKTDGEQPIPLTLREVCKNALRTSLPGEQMGWAEKCDLWALGARIHDNDEPNLTAEEISMLKERIGKIYTPVVVGPAIIMLDPTKDSKHEK